MEDKGGPAYTGRGMSGHIFQFFYKTFPERWPRTCLGSGVWEGFRVDGFCFLITIRTGGQRVFFCDWI